MSHKYQPGEPFIRDGESVSDKLAEVAGVIGGVEPGPQRIALTGAVKALAGIVVVCSAIFGAGVTWSKMASSMAAETTELRRTITDISKQQDSNTSLIRDMDRNGHPDHEKRIRELELKEPGKVAAEVSALTTQISALSTIVATDHDHITRILTLLENRTIEKPQQP